MAFQFRRPKGGQSAAILAGVGTGLHEGVKNAISLYLAHKNVQAYMDRTKYYQDILAREDAARQGGEAAAADPVAGVKLRKPALPGVPDAPAVGGTPDPSEGEQPTTPSQTAGNPFHPSTTEQSVMDKYLSGAETDPAAASVAPGSGALMTPTTVPTYQQGTAYVPRTGPALLHQGEEVVPAQENPNATPMADSMEPPPRANMVARPQTLQAPGPTGGAVATPTGGGPLQQAEEYQVDPKVLDAYKRAGQADVERQRFQAQLRAELHQFRQMEQKVADLTFQARHLKQQLEIAKAANPEHVPLIEAKILEMQGTQRYYEKQLGDFRDTVLSLAKDDEGNVTDQRLHEGLTHWLDKGATAGERAGIEEGLTHHRAPASRLPGGGGPRLPRQPGLRRQAGPVSAAVIGGQQL